MFAATTTQTAQVVSEMELLPKINPEHEAFFRQFVPTKYMGEYGHREFHLVSITLSARGETVAVYETAVSSSYYSGFFVFSSEYRIKNGELIERRREKMGIDKALYAETRALAFAKYGRQ
ncbi:hypothetical protein RRU01S_04_01730 [Agrobacterium rubi TR3 = NBRC 13261]|uniref:Uncharacterized protein n=1 Tax=Agrobacterium rubi TR3 = NBRC 13261 TaxID=1368415 RepID=A0A081CRQ5_9HYPH|nr:hypothetical protein [Agrobacterium rubi]MBP1876839.1 hypothetical protein [Agrobacterium rubi]MCL6651032.1 hypothetical protein [Agrobacterium rubi]GAK69351.1 hypothetical protein RRU01S_04_01730 [Agrobacterium rubi TR3 = NBRC 13261]